jgi:phenylalanyl-tRNA synthetase alpha chain
MNKNFLKILDTKPVTKLLVERDQGSNLTNKILHAATKQPKLHNLRNHPLEIIKTRVASNFKGFKHFDNFSPVVSTFQNFDSLLIPIDHPSRSRHDSYYFNEREMLRTHTSAHQYQLLSSGNEKFLVSADVYRRDEIDRYHYPVFHQMEGVCLMKTGNNISKVEDDLKSSLSKAVMDLIPFEKMRWVDAYFPFTSPSWEMEIFYNNKWIEVCGCGIVENDILRNAGIDVSEYKAWAFGIGLERLAMILFDIPDIRLFWSQDPRFLSQFFSGDIRTKFKPFSKYPALYKDISFWINDDYHELDFMEVIREVCGDLVENVELIDEFTSKIGKKSKCYRILYRSMERTLLGEEIEILQKNLASSLSTKLNLVIR